MDKILNCCYLSGTASCNHCRNNPNVYNEELASLNEAMDLLNDEMLDEIYSEDLADDPV